MLRSEAAVGVVIRLSTVTRPDIPRQVLFTHATKHSQIRLEQGEQALRTVFVDVTPRVFLLRVIDILMYITLHCPIATGGICVELTACLDGEVSGLLYGLHGEIFGRLDD